MIERGLHDGKEDPKKIDPYGPFAAFSLLEYGGLKHILPFLGGRSDAACRVVIKTVGLWVGGAQGHRMGMVARWAGESSRCEDPAPTVGVCGDAIVRRIAIPMLPLPPPCACHAAHGEPRFYNRGGMGREGAFGGLRVRGGGRATFGPPLQHRPYPERNRKSRQWVEIFIALRRCKTNA